jgi:arginine-tRNA-protein transferase
MRHSLPRAPQFYVTAPQECPYLKNETERKLFTSLSGSDAQVLNNALSTQGFRRSQNVLYRPSCADCSACLSARIPVAHFSFSKSEKRVIRRNNSLIREIKAPWATSEQYELFKRYVNNRHEKGGMSGMSETEFASMVEETCVKTILTEYSTPDHINSTIKAISITDVIEDGLSMVYSFYEPKLPELSLGRYMILDHINLAKEMDLPYLYLGYWVKGSKKMDYKSQYSPIEIFTNGKWSLLQSEARDGTTLTVSSQTSEAVSNTIYLPESNPK